LRYGRFARETALPPLKELQKRYGVCYKTMRMILRALVEENVLQQSGRNYSHKDAGKSAWKERLVFITYRSPVPLISAINQGQYKVLELLEHECIGRSIKLDIVEIDFYNPIESRKAMADRRISHPAIGYIFDIWWYTSKEFQDAHTDLLTRLLSFNRPVAIIDEVGTLKLPVSFYSHPALQIFRFEDRSAGDTMARLLLDLGHRNVVFLSSVHDLVWSKRRLQGVQEAFAASGQDGHVVPVVKGDIELDHERALAISGLDDRVVQAIFSKAYAKDLAREMFKTYSRVKKTYVPQHLSRADIRELRKNLRIFNNLVALNQTPEMFKLISEDIIAQSGAIISLKVRSALFDEALSHREATAWICANDSIAMSAQSYLLTRQIAVPKRLSVVGYDNISIQALEHRLTTYDFNARGFVHCAMNFITRPQRVWARHSVTAVDGVIMRRDTTAPMGVKSTPGIHDCA
jgi:DNA-binding LacI/PurR family transcriptional regulator